MKHAVEAGDIWRMCQTKDAPIRDWVKLAVNRARATGNPTVFWLNKNRAHDANLITKVDAYLPEHDTDRPRHPDPGAGRSHQAGRCCSAGFGPKDGQDTISVTGNVLRDYLTDPTSPAKPCVRQQPLMILYRDWFRLKY